MQHDKAAIKNAACAAKEKIGHGKTASRVTVLPGISSRQVDGHLEIWLYNDTAQEMSFSAAHDSVVVKFENDDMVRSLTINVVRDFFDGNENKAILRPNSETIKTSVVMNDASHYTITFRRTEVNGWIESDMPIRGGTS